MKLFFFIHRWAGISVPRVLLKIMYGLELSRGARIGESVTRGMGTIINLNSIIGNNTMLEHHVLLGVRNRRGRILISSNCCVGAYELLTGVTIGDNCKIEDRTLVLEYVSSAIR